MLNYDKMEELKKLIRNMSEKDLKLLYEITKLIAESDSIGESWSYCSDYTKIKFEDEKNKILNNSISMNNYILEGGIDMFKLFKGEYEKDNII